MPISIWVILFLLVVVGLWGAVTYNCLVAMRQQCTQAFADVDVQLKRRHDLVAAARRAYNAMIQGNNTMVQQFPTVLIAWAFGFGTHEFFNISDEREALPRAPTLKF